MTLELPAGFGCHVANIGVKDTTDDFVVIPSGVAHGFLALEPLQLLYLVTNAYDGSDEFGFAWDDAAAAVPWPTIPDGRPTLSERDRSNPTLADLVVRLRHDP